MTPKTALADFNQKLNRSEPKPLPELKKRGSETVTVTVRLSPEHWRRLRDLATQQRSTLQAISMHGYNLVLQELGLPPLDVA